MRRKLTPKEVVFKFDMEKVKLKDSIDMLPQYDIAYNKIKTAIEIKNQGYNVYLIDDYSKSNVESIMKYVNEILKSEKAPKDICYVIKDDIKKPIPLLVSNGKGKVFKELLEHIQNTIADKTFEFYTSSISKEKEQLVGKIQKKRSDMLCELISISKNSGFDIRTSEEGFTFIPLSEEKEMTEDEYDKLDEQEKEDMITKVNELKIKTKEILEDLKDIESHELEKVKEIMEEYLYGIMKIEEEECIKILDQDVEAQNYLIYIIEKMLEELLENYNIDYDEDEDKINEIIFKYMINVIVDNSDKKSPPVIFEEDPSLNNLLGSIEYENHNGVYISDVSLIKAGSFLKANGGCLIIRINSLLSNPQSYYYLKKVLLSEKVDLDYNKGYLELLALGGLKPEPIKAVTKVILIGNYEFYDVLYNNDEEFKKIFKIRAECNPLIGLDKMSKEALLREIMDCCERNNVGEITTEAISEIGKYLCRKCESRDKMYFDTEIIKDLILLAKNDSERNKKDKIDCEEIIKIAYNEEIMEKEVMNSYKEKRNLIKVDSSEVGQVNGLSVIDIGYISFGRPIRITCNCYKGNGTIIHAQREGNLSGKIHDKAISILNGYINNLVGGYKKIPVDFHLNFEQIYGIVDGDSASVGEVICILSSITKIPVKQNIAVTGSINQFGEIQPIGGVNEKIEGFFKVCKNVDSIKNKGVLIPFSNKNDLVLSKEVEEAIQNGDFNIYTMESIDDAIKVLMDKSSINIDKVKESMQKEFLKYNEK